MDDYKFKATGDLKDMVAFRKAISKSKDLLLDRFRKSRFFRTDYTIEPENTPRYISEFRSYPDVVVKLQPKNKGEITIVGPKT
jgi:hypothetical protein